MKIQNLIVVTDDPQIYALALIDRHGDQAAIYAAMEADERLDAGDLDRAAFWRLVLAAINRMVEPESDKEATRH